MKVGLPEAFIPLGFSVIDLTLSPKSKSACEAVLKAKKSIDDTIRPVRDYLMLNNANLSDDEQYDYDKKEIWQHLEYLPEGLEDLSFYYPNTTGKYERALKEMYEKYKSNKRYTSVKEAKKHL